MAFCNQKYLIDETSSNLSFHVFSKSNLAFHQKLWWENTNQLINWFDRLSYDYKISIYGPLYLCCQNSLLERIMDFYVQRAICQERLLHLMRTTIDSFESNLTVDLRHFLASFLESSIMIRVVMGFKTLLGDNDVWTLAEVSYSDPWSRKYWLV